jgi:hypothetical protein
MMNAPLPYLLSLYIYRVYLLYLPLKRAQILLALRKELPFAEGSLNGGGASGHTLVSARPTCMA